MTKKTEITQKKPAAVKAERHVSQRKGIPTPWLVGICFCLAAACIIIWELFASGSREAASQAYEASKNSQMEEKYTEYYESSYASAEEKSHVKNRVAIYVDSLQTEPKLEVLRVSDVEYSIVEPEKNGGNVSSWLEIPGYGVFTVDLSAGEFIVDNERENVLVRVPKPELTELTLDYDGIKELFWKQGYRDYSYGTGEALAQEQLNDGYLQIRRYMTSNQKLYNSAAEAAVNMITFLVKQLNPGIPDLQVAVEFMD